MCIGCGLCEAIGKEKGYIMNLKDNGFYEPVCTAERNIEVEIKISKICPAINIDAPKVKDSKVWGGIINLYKLSASDSEVQKMGSSGGGISGVCIYLLENKIVDGILHVGKIPGESIENKLFISRTKSEVVNNASSRYAPAKVFNEISDIFEKRFETFAFIGKPCDIAGIKNYLQLNPQYKPRIKYYFSFFCAGMPSYNATHKLLEEANRKEMPYFLKYRGDGWPGYFKAIYKNTRIVKMTYEKSWGKVLGRHLHTRCKICPDGIGLLADIVFGDAWETQDGYPDFEEKEGRSLAIARTQMGDELIRNAFKNKYISLESLTIERISKMQPYQYQRRLLVGYRILVIQFLTNRLLNFKGTGYLSLMSKYPLNKGLKNSFGTLKRFLFKSRD